MLSYETPPDFEIAVELENESFDIYPCRYKICSGDFDYSNTGFFGENIQIRDENDILIMDYSGQNVSAFNRKVQTA